MTTIGFVCRSISKRANAEPHLYCQVRDKEHGLNMLFLTPIKVKLTEWKAAHGRNVSKKAVNNYRKTYSGRLVEAQITVAEGQVRLALAEGITDSKEISKRVENALVLEEARKEKKEAEKLQTSCILPFMDNFLERVDKNEVKTPKGKALDITTKNYYHKLRAMFGGYIQEDANITFDDLNEDYRDGFISYCEDANIMRSTIKQYLSKMGAVCRKAWNRGCISADKVGVLKLWGDFVVNTNTDMKEEVALDRNEVEALFNMDLSDNEKYDSIDRLVRDIAVAGVDVIQRWSDYGVLSSDMIRNIDNRDYYVFVQKKTGKQIRMPICGVVVGHLQEIMERNGGTFSKFDIKSNEYVSKVCRTTFANRLKKLLRDLSVSVPSLKEVYTTPMTCDEISMENDFILLCKQHENGTLKTASADYYRWKRGMRLQALNGAIGTGRIFRRNAKCKDNECLKEKWQLCNSHTMRRSGATIALKDGKLSHEQVKRLGGWSTEKAFSRYDHRKEDDLDADIYDAIQQTEDAVSATVLPMAVNQ